MSPEELRLLANTTAEQCDMPDSFPEWQAAKEKARAEADRMEDLPPSIFDEDAHEEYEAWKARQ